MSPLHLDDGRAQRYLDDLLPAPERAEAERHLSTCAGCRLVVDGYRALAEALGDLEVPPLPAGFTDGVLGRIEERERVASRERRIAAGILGLATAAVAVLALAAGPSGWAPVLSRAGDTVGGLATWFRLGAAVAEPLLRALRIEIAAATAGAAIPLLFAVRRLSQRRAEIAA